MQVLDYLRTAGVIALLSFKPSEPHLTKYLTEVKGLSADDVNNAVYPTGTYAAMAMLVLLVVSKAFGRQVTAHCILSDRFLIVLGCGGRLATRFLLLFGEGVRAAQLMQVTYASGGVAEFMLYAYALKVVPSEQTQRLASIVQASYLISHTSAALLGDVLLPKVGLRGLMWISAVSVAAAFLLALTLRNVDHPMPSVIHPLSTWKAAYRSHGFWILSQWWVVNYAVYMTVYGYETSLYADLFGERERDRNGTINAVALMAGAAAGLPLALPAVQVWASKFRICIVMAISLAMAGATLVMVNSKGNQWILGAAFTILLIAWSFGNALFYGETRRAIDDAIKVPTNSTCHEARNLLVQLPSLNDESLEVAIFDLVSFVCVANSSLGSLTNSVFSLVVFSYWQLDVSLAFALVMCLSLASIALTCAARAFHATHLQRHPAAVMAMTQPQTTVGAQREVAIA